MGSAPLICLELLKTEIEEQALFSHIRPIIEMVNKLTFNKQTQVEANPLGIQCITKLSIAPLNLPAAAVGPSACGREGGIASWN